MEHPAQQIAIQDCILAIKEADARHDRLVEQIEAAVPSWATAPLVASLQAMRGIALITAGTIVGEIGDISRFETPRRPMAYLGPVSAEHSSGTKIRRRRITRAGIARVRRLLVESAWTYCRNPRVSQSIQRRQEGLRSRHRQRRSSGCTIAVAGSLRRPNRSSRFMLAHIPPSAHGMLTGRFRGLGG